MLGTSQFKILPKRSASAFSTDAWRMQYVIGARAVP